MRAEAIQAGDVLVLKPARARAYGLDDDHRTFEVSGLKARPGYKTPFVFCKSRRPEGGLLFFEPSDFARRAK